MQFMTVGPVLAASASTGDKELDGIRVTGELIKPARDPQKIFNWLKLLVGRFDYSGYVRLKGEGISCDLPGVDGKLVQI